VLTLSLMSYTFKHVHGEASMSYQTVSIDSDVIKG
jgi:hypothetical protein